MSNRKIAVLAPLAELLDTGLKLWNRYERQLADRR